MSASSIISYDHGNDRNLNENFLCLSSDRLTPTLFGSILPLLAIIPKKNKFSFQKIFKKFDSLYFFQSGITFANSNTKKILEFIPTIHIEKIIMNLTKYLNRNGSISYQLKLSLNLVEGMNKNIFISDIIPPFCQQLAETMEYIVALNSKYYHIPIESTIPFFF